MAKSNVSNPRFLGSKLFNATVAEMQYEMLQDTGSKCKSQKWENGHKLRNCQKAQVFLALPLFSMVWDRLLCCLLAIGRRSKEHQREFSMPRKVSERK